MNENSIDRDGVRPHSGTSSAPSDQVAGSVPAARHTALVARLRRALRSAMSDDTYLKPVVPALRSYPYSVTRCRK
jgi:hypothetical protein